MKRIRRGETGGGGLPRLGFFRQRLSKSLFFSPRFLRLPPPLEPINPTTYTTVDCPVLQSANFPYSTPGTSITAMNYNPMINLNTGFSNVSQKAPINNFGEHQAVGPTSTNVVSEQQEMFGHEWLLRDLQSWQPNQPEQVNMTNIGYFHQGPESLDGMHSQISDPQLMLEIDSISNRQLGSGISTIPCSHCHTEDMGSTTAISSTEKCYAPQELMDLHQNQIEVQDAPSIPSGTLQTDDLKDQTGASNTDFSTLDEDLEYVLKNFACSPDQFSF